MRQNSISFEGMYYFPIPCPSGGVDRESHSLNMPDDCCREMRNCDFIYEFLFGQRKGTKLITIVSNADGTRAEKIKSLYYFKMSDESVQRWYYTCGNSMYAKDSQYEMWRIIRSGLDYNATPRHAEYNNCLYNVNGVDAPWVVRPAVFTVSGLEWRPAGLTTPDLAKVTAALRDEAEGSLSQDEYHQYAVSFGMDDSESQLEGNFGTNVSTGLYYVEPDDKTTATKKSYKITFAADFWPDAQTNINRAHIYRGVGSADKIADGGVLGVMYYCGTINRGVYEFIDRVADDALDLTRELPIHRDPPPTTAKQIVQYMGQMLYISGSSIYYTTIGEPEYCKYVLTIDNARGGDITGACVDLLGNLIVFKEEMSYRVSRWAGDPNNEMLDYSPIGQGIGCVAPATIRLTPYGIMFLGKQDIYLWDSNNYTRVTNKYGVGISPMFEGIAIKTLSQACAVYDYERDRYKLWYADPNYLDYYGVASNTNNCGLVCDLRYKRWIWPHTEQYVGCVEVCRDYNQAQAIWAGSSCNGFIFQLESGNLDFYNDIPPSQWGLVPGVEAPDWGIVGATDNPKWSGKLGEQIYMHMISKEFNLLPGAVESSHRAFIEKQLLYLFGDVAPLPSTEPTMRIWIEDMSQSGAIAIYDVKPTQFHGWDYAQWDISTWDAEVTEKIDYMFPQGAKGRAFRIHIEHPYQKILNEDGTIKKPEKPIFIGGAPKVKYLVLAWRECRLQVATTY